MAALSPSTTPNIHDSQQKATIGATIPFVILAVISVVCRLAARRIQKLRLEFDDYSIIIGLVCTLGCFSLSMEMVHLGSGKHIQTVPQGNIAQYFKVSLHESFRLISPSLRHGVTIVFICVRDYLWNVHPGY